MAIAISVSQDDEWAVDLHVKVLTESVVERAKARGIDVLVYAPHFERLPAIRDAATAYSDDDVLVVPAREVFTGTWKERKHVLGIGLTDPIPDFVTLEGAIAELRRQGAAVVVPHPEFFTVGLTEADLRRHRADVDAIEVYNPKHWPRHNHRARELAGSLDLPAVASSYAHLEGTVGEAWTAFETPIETEAALVTALREGVPRRPLHRRGASHDARRLAEFAHLGWENTWKKLDRVLLSGTEPTHPDHIAYGGAFDDIAVY